MKIPTDQIIILNKNRTKAKESIDFKRSKIDYYDIRQELEKDCNYPCEYDTHVYPIIQKAKGMLYNVVGEDFEVVTLKVGSSLFHFSFGIPCNLQSIEVD